jgi:hypothetical protein
MVRSMQIVHLSCVKISTISKRTKLSLEHHHLGVPSGASKVIFEPLVHLARTVHLSCTDTNTVSKQKEERFPWPTSPRSSILHWQWHYLETKRREIPHDPRHLGVLSGTSKTIPKPMVHWMQTVHYLASRLALLQTGQPFTWASSPRSTIGCVQNDFWADGTFGANCTHILHRH